MMLGLSSPICKGFCTLTSCTVDSMVLVKTNGIGIARLRSGLSHPFRTYSFSSIRCCSSSSNHVSCNFPDQSSVVSLPKPAIATAGYEKCESAKTLVKGMTYHELEAWVKSLGYRAGQAMMLWKCLYGNGVWAQHVDEMKALSKQFRATLEKTAEFSVFSLKDVYSASDGTRKILFSLGDGLIIETVLIPCERGRTTLCVSSQVGCAMNCQFCYTGRMGLKRNLTAAEIVEQVVYACRHFTNEVGPITNVVFMGMGEPLHNLDNVLRAAEIIVDCHGLHFSPRKVTVSTSGLIPQMKHFIRESPCVLAVSLNATTDEVRNWIMPINRKYNLDMLLTMLREEIGQRHKFKVLFEYVMLAGINDSLDDARRLVSLVEGIPCKINLISFNHHEGSSFIPSTKEQMLAFHKIVADAGYATFIRHSRGNDQMAACGQLGKPGNSQPPRMRAPERFWGTLAF